MIALSRHAIEQIAKRPVTSQAEVLAVVNALENAIKGSTQYREVRVVIKTLKVKYVAPDGSNGDVVLACVDPRRGVVSTVMLQRRSQVEHKRSTGDVPYL